MTVKPFVKRARIALVFGGAKIKVRIAIFAILIVAVGGFGYYKLIYRPAHLPVIETDYVISPSLDVLDTYAPVHTTMEVLKAGDPADVVRRSRDWSQIRLPNGGTGWVLSSQLMGPKTFAAGKQLLQRVSGEQVQALGQTSGMVNLHVEPSREADLLDVLSADEKIQLYDRKLVERGASAAGAATSGAPGHPLEAWYLVKAESRPRSVGWVLGRLITLDIPSGISQYAQAYNLVAWRTLATVDDNGRQIPEYVVADRIGSEDVDFNHIRVLTWGLKQHHYVTAFVEGGLKGEFPVITGKAGDVPYFSLRLTDKDGKKIQKFYGLYDTIVRPMGTVAGWEGNSAPPAETSRATARTRRRH